MRKTNQDFHDSGDAIVEYLLMEEWTLNEIILILTIATQTAKDRKLVNDDG